MISGTLFKRNMIAGFKLMIPFIAILTLYNCVIIWMYDPKLSESLKQFQEIMPEMMAAVGMTGSTGTMIEFINTYLYGFIMLFIPVIFVIMMVNKTIMHYVDNGSVACLLATPNSRGKIIRTQLLSVMILLFALITIMASIGFTCSQVLFDGALDVKKYVLLNVATVLLDFAISGICVLAACIFNESKWYLMIGAGMPLLFYVIQMMANMGGKLEKFKYVTLFTLMPGEKIIAGKSGVWEACIILFLIGIVLYFIGSSIFQRKDLNA